jgi:beta-lactamase regulating signal transducer with metallopeptidase domain
MIAIIERIDQVGGAFVGFALPMLIQSGALISILLLIDLLLRKRVRAVFRYWIWMLVLVKLVLPTSLSSPVSVGRWFGDELTYVDATPQPKLLPQVDVIPAPMSVPPPDTPPIADVPPVETAARSPDAVPAEPTIQRAEPIVTVLTDPAPATPPLSWQGAAFLAWLVVLVVMTLVLLQRVLFVRRLVAQASEANSTMAETLADCRERIALKEKIGLKVSGGASSPAVCGLFRPVILVPESLTPSLSTSELRVVLLHELAHVKRRDLWVNFAQTLLQIFYFYNPLLWLANAMIRRAREQAVDEMVLVAMGEKARQYPHILVKLAKLAFKRPGLSLRLIGVVESKSALTGRIKHILNRPIPRTAKLGVLGLLVVVIAAVVLLPMARSDKFGSWFGRKPLVKFSSDDKPTGNRVKAGNTITYSKNYTVEFRKDEKLAIIAELYQVGKPMRHLGCKIFSSSEQPQKLSVMLRTDYRNADRTFAEHDLKIVLGDQTFRLNDILVNTPEFFNSTSWSFFTETEITEPERKGKPYAEFQNLLRVRPSRPRDGKPRSPRIWMPTYNDVTWTVRDGYFISVNMFAMSQLDNLQVHVPHYAEKMQLPDGAYISGDGTKEQRKAVADDYLLSIRRALMREQMPLPELTAHKYYEVGDPIYVCVDGRSSKEWRPTLEEIDRDAETNPAFFLIDGKEYASRVGFGPFGGGGNTLHLPGELYVDADDFHLPPGKHRVAYGWKNLDVINPDDPDRVVHYDKLTTDVVVFDVVEELPTDYYAEIHEKGWDEILRRSIETPFTDDMKKYHVSGPLLALQIESLPFDIAFEIHAQAEGSEERFYAGRIARKANSGRYMIGCDRQVDELNWDTVGEKRWRLILVPSRTVAMQRPPIHHYYGREFVTDWVTFEKYDRFQENQRRAYVRDTLDRDMPRIIVFLPDLETPDANTVLDLASGQMLSAKGMEEDRQYFKKLGKGDLAYEYVANKAGLLCLRGATMQLRTNKGLEPLTPDVQRQYFVGYFIDKVPSQCQITTAEGNKFGVKVLSVEKGDDGRVQIEYSKAPVEAGSEATWGEEVGGVRVRLGGSKLLGLFFTNNTLWFELNNRSNETVELNTQPYSQKATNKAQWGYVEITDVNGRLVDYESRAEKSMWSVEPGKRYKVHSFLNGRPLRKSGPGIYKARVTLVVRALQSGKTFEVKSNWHPFEVTPCGYPPGFAPKTAFEELRQANAYRHMMGFGHATIQEVISRYEAVIKQYPNSKYALESHFGIAKAASENRDLTAVTEEDYALSRRHYQTIIRKWPDVVTNHTIHARNQAYFRTAQSEQSRRALYRWLKSLTDDQKINSVKNYLIWPFEPSEEDIHRALGALEKTIALHIRVLEESGLKTAQPSAARRDVGLGIPRTRVPIDKSRKNSTLIDNEITGSVVDVNGEPIADAQVALSTEKVGVQVSDVKLEPMLGNVESRIVETDSQGDFNIGQQPEGSFDLIAVHDRGFAIVGSDDFLVSSEIRLQPWGRIEGRVAEGRYTAGNKIWMGGSPNSSWFLHKREYRYETKCNAGGHFVFEKVPAGWFEAGYLIRTGEMSASITCRTPFEVKAGETAEITLGGSGRPVVGHFVPPEDYKKTIYFGNGLRSLITTRPDEPRPENYNRMTRREQHQWRTQWRKSDQYRHYRDSYWHDPNWRQYTFRVNDDGSFRIEDVIAGKYDLTVWIEERITGAGRPEEIGSYDGTIEVPPMTGGQSDEPLDLGELVLAIHEPLRVGDMAPLFEAKTLDGRDLRLIDYRGKFVLLSFWQPVSHPEIDRLRELYDTYKPGGRLKIIGLAGHDTLGEVRKYLKENPVPWPQVYIGQELKSGIAKDYCLPGLPWIFLVGPDGKILATSLRGDKLESLVHDSLKVAGDGKHDIGTRVNTITGDNLFEVARSLNYKVGPEWFRVAESADNGIYVGLERLAETGGEPRFNEVLDDWVCWKYDLDAVVDTDSAMALFDTFCDQFDSEEGFFANAPRARAIKLICDKLDTDELMDRYVAALSSGRSFCSDWTVHSAFSIEERKYTGHEGADILPASVSAVWYALLRIDESLDRRYPASCNIIEEKLTPILIEDYKKRQRQFVLDNAVLLGGPAIAEFLLRKDWRDEEVFYNIETFGSPPRPVNKWLLRLINLDDPAGEKFRAEHRDIVLKFTDMWAESFTERDQFNPPKFLLFDRRKGRDSFAWQYWPVFLNKTDKLTSTGQPLTFKFRLKLSYLKMLEPFTTTQMYLNCWIRALDELDKKYLNARGPLEHLPAHRKHKLAEMVLKQVNGRLEKIDLSTEKNSNRWSRLVYHRTILSDFLNKE